MKLIQYPQGRRDAPLEREILKLEGTAWPSETAERFPSAPGTHAASFVLLENDTAVCHVGVRKTILLHREQTYSAYGLSEVVTHPLYQGRGLASALIRKAAQFMTEQQADVSVFTCDPARVSFYARGGWTAAEGTCFVGGTREKPFRSDSLGLVTMLRLLSAKALAHRSDFEHTELFFELGENQLW